MLDPVSPMPLYQQLADELTEYIRAGSYRPGAQIPSEHELAARYGLGRPTVRQATELLVRRRVLERRRGAGTFVCESNPEVDLFSLGGTLASFRRSGIDLKTRWLKKLGLRRVAPDPDNPFSGERAYTLVRLGTVSRRPVLLERVYFRAVTFPGMDDSPPRAGQSLSAFIEQRYRLRPRGGRQTFRVHRAEGLAARTLGLNETSALLLVKRTLDFPGAPAAIFVELFCHTEEMVFAQDLVLP